MKIHKNDTIMVTVGKDRGRTGQVERVILVDQLVVIPGINTYKKHRKPAGQDRPGEIVTLVRPLSVAKVALVCPKCKQPTRVGYRIQDGKKIRVCRKCDSDIDAAKVIKPVKKDKK